MYKKIDDENSLTSMIWSELMNNTQDYKGIDYTKLRAKIYNTIIKDIENNLFDYGPITPYDINKEIDKQTFTLLILGHLEAHNGYIFSNDRINLGEHIPSGISRELNIYKSVYKDDILE